LKISPALDNSNMIFNSLNFSSFINRKNLLKGLLFFLAKNERYDFSLEDF